MVSDCEQITEAGRRDDTRIGKLWFSVIALVAFAEVESHMRKLVASLHQDFCNPLKSFQESFCFADSICVTFRIGPRSSRNSMRLPKLRHAT